MSDTSLKATPTDFSSQYSILDTVRHLRNTRHPWVIEGFQQFELAYKHSDFLL
eukprot:TRINITY_DN862_c1_g1_i1.p2 TRINITY_DN862_c1_g1~~TRINITY_DN862_c1_g1_i1.p2  ORF type:complete len:53 (+),score=4.30 TRINITY_DN862_c1_g1_i1:178-336(+)